MAAATIDTTAARPGHFRWAGSIDPVHLLLAEALLLTLIPGRLVFSPLGGVGAPAQVLGLLMLALWAVTVLTPGFGPVRRCASVRYVLAALWATMLASYVLMNSHPVDGDELANTERFLITMASFSGIVLMAAEGLRTKAELLRVVRTAVIGVGFMSLVAILQFRPGLDLTEYMAKIPLLSPNGELTSIQARGGFTRPAGTALHPIEFGVIAGTALAFAIHLAIYDKGQSRVRRFVPFVLIGFAIPVSISRSALLTAALVAAYFFFGATAALRRRGLMVLGAFAVVVFTTIPGMLGTLKGFVLAGESDESISSRTSDFAAVANYVTDSPWLGRGPGSFLPTYRILDNQYLLTLVETGIIGLACVILLVGLPAALGRIARRRSPDVADRSLGQAFAGAGVATMAAGLTFDAFSFPTFLGMTGMWIGLAAAWYGISVRPGAPVIRPDELAPPAAR